MLRSIRSLRVMAFLFLVYGTIGLVWPHEISSLVNLNLDNISSTNDVRSVYGGLFIGIRVAFIILSRNKELGRVGLYLQILFLGGLALGRSVSFLLDGTPNKYVIALFIAELIGCLIAFYYLRNLTNSDRN